VWGGSVRGGGCRLGGDFVRRFDRAFFLKTLKNANEI